MASFFRKFPFDIYSLDNGKNYSIVIDILKRVKYKNSFLQNSYSYYTYSVKDGESAEDIAFKYYGSPYYSWVIYLANNIENPYYEWILDSNKFEKFLKHKYSTYTFTVSGNTTFPEYNETGYRKPINVYHQVIQQVANSSSLIKNTVGKFYLYKPFITNGSMNKVSLVPIEGMITDLSGYLSIVDDYSSTNNDMKVVSYSENDNEDWRTFINQFVHHYEDNNGNEVYYNPTDITDAYNSTTALPVTFFDYEDKLNESKRTIKLIDKIYLQQIEADLGTIL